MCFYIDALILFIDERTWNEHNQLFSIIVLVWMKSKFTSRLRNVYFLIAFDIAGHDGFFCGKILKSYFILLNTERIYGFLLWVSFILDTVKVVEQ